MIIEDKGYERDIVHVSIFGDTVEVEKVGKGKVHDWNGSIELLEPYKHSEYKYVYFSDGYLPNEKEQIVKYLTNRKKEMRHHIVEIQTTIDAIDIEMAKILSGGEYNVY